MGAGRSSTRPLLLIVIVLLIIGIVLAATFLFVNLRKKTAPTGQQQTPVSGSPSVSYPTNIPANIEIDNTGYGVYEQSDLTNPNVQGVVVEMNWADVEPQQGQFNWGPADRQIAAWAAHGKKFVIVVRYVHEPFKGGCTSQQGQYLPAWEVARIPHFCSATGSIVPDYFNATFKSDLLAYVNAISQHISSGSYKQDLVYVRIGVGMGGEGYPCIQCDATNIAQLTSWGFSFANWENWQEEMLTAYKAAFPGVPIIYPLGYNKMNPATGQPVDQDVAYWAAAHGMGVGQEGLSDNPRYANGSIVKMCAYIRSHYPSAYIQLTPVHQVTQLSQVQGDIAIAQKAGAFTIEWFPVDTTTSSFQPALQQWKQNVATRLSKGTS